MKTIWDIQRYLNRPHVAATFVIGSDAGWQPDEGKPTRILFAADSTLETFSGVENLVETLVPIIQARRPELVERGRAMLARICPTLFPGHEPDPFLHAEAITGAVIRRISRETVYLAGLIDEAARFLCQAFRLVPGPVQVVCRQADWLDRPSARVLYRALHLLEADDHIELVLLFANDPEEGGLALLVFGDRFRQARRLLYRRLREDWKPRTLRGQSFPSIEGAFPDARALPASCDAEGWHQALARALVYQNYDQLYMTAAVALEQLEAGDARAHVWRLVAIADVNMGEVNSALEAVAQAQEEAVTPTLKALLEYARGLLLTKRAYALDAARASYERGLAHLASENPQRAEVRVERAWIDNGLALLDALLARREPAQRAALLERALRRELEAFSLVADAPGSPAAYLRNNLLANIAFLLEIDGGRFEDAITFWQQAFAPFLTDPAFEKLYRYRLGVLLGKAGRWTEAVVSLERASELASGEGDLFLAEPITYALAFTLLANNQPARAAEAFAEGGRLAVELRDWPAFFRQALGVACSLARLGRPEEAAVWHQRAAQVAPTFGLSPALMPTTAGPLVKPPPKLPAYVPAIDLEATPAVSLNDVLTGRGPGLPTATPGAA
jgi:tetratricopeptide (TPR) repeat protein